MINGLIGIWLICMYIYRYSILNFALDRYIDIKYKVLPMYITPKKDIYGLDIEKMQQEKGIIDSGQNDWTRSDASIKITNESDHPINIPYCWNDEMHVFPVNAGKTITMPIYSYEDLLSSPKFDTSVLVVDKNATEIEMNIMDYAGPKGNFYTDIDTRDMRLLIPECKDKEYSLIIEDMFGIQQKIQLF